MIVDDNDDDDCVWYRSVPLGWFMASLDRGVMHRRWRVCVLPQAIFVLGGLDDLDCNASTELGPLFVLLHTLE